MTTNYPQLIFNLAQDVATTKKHEFITREHILYAICIEQEGSDFLKNLEIAPTTLIQKIEEYFLENRFSLQIASTLASPPTTTEESIEALQNAAMHTLYSSAEKTSPCDILLELINKEDSYASYLLSELELNRLRLMEQNRPQSGGSKKSEEQFSNEPLPNKNEIIFKEVSIDLVENVKKGGNYELIGRQNEVGQILRVLARKKKNHPLLVGDPGVGKTAIAEGLAALAATNSLPKSSPVEHIFSLDMGSLIAGTKFRGDFEERLKAFFTHVTTFKNAIIFIDEIHTVIGAGGTNGSSLDASNILKPILESPNIKCMGSTTHEEYNRIFEKDHAFSRRFKKIEIKEPSDAETLDILKGIKKRYESFHKVKYSTGALEKIIELTSKHMNRQKNPDKSIDVLDEAGAKSKLSENSANKTVSVDEIEKVISEITKIPIEAFTKKDTASLKTFSKNLKLEVFGQDEAIQKIEEAVLTSKAGLGSAERPIASLLFAGPTGVGKTELAKATAKILEIPIIRFDMSEYKEQHTISRLVGAPPGYVGFEKGGLLTDAIDRDPHCVLLLDEIEKAHSDIYNLLLQILDYGVLTSASGKKSNFRNAIIIMTTNAGATEGAGANIGFGTIETTRDTNNQLKDYFSPEFRNRLNAIITFNPLSKEHFLKIIDKFTNEINELLANKKISIVLSGSLKNHIYEKGHKSQLGARELRRVMDNLIRVPLTKEILFKKERVNGVFEIDIHGEELSFEFSKHKV